jgi:tetratricopeptide (TPR) repeat protein
VGRKDMPRMMMSQEYRSQGRIVTISNPYTEMAMQRALNFELEGNYFKSLEVYDQVLEKDPREARAYHAKGDIYDRLGMFEDAVSCYSSALECDPFNAETWYNKAISLRKMGRFEESTECMLQGLSLAL